MFVPLFRLTHRQPIVGIPRKKCPFSASGTSSLRRRDQNLLCAGSNMSQPILYEWCLVRQRHHPKSKLVPNPLEDHHHQKLCRLPDAEPRQVRFHRGRSPWRELGLGSAQGHHGGGRIARCRGLVHGCGSIRWHQEEDLGSLLGSAPPTTSRKAVLVGFAFQRGTVDLRLCRFAAISKIRVGSLHIWPDEHKNIKATSDESSPAGGQLQIPCLQGVLLRSGEFGFSTNG